MPSVPATNKIRTSLALDGVDLGVVMTHSGGGVGGESSKIRPGADEDEVILADVKTYENITFSALYTDAWRARRTKIDSRINKGVIVASMQPLDADGNPFGAPEIVNGQLIRFKPPDSDANATGDGAAAACEIEMSVGSWA